MPFRLAALIFALCGTGCAEAFFYHPSTAAFDTPDDLRDVYFTTADGKRLHGLFASAGAGRPGVLVLHGNSGNVGGRIDTVRRLRGAGFSTLMIDYRGFGRSDPPGRRYARQDLLRDAEAGLVFLRTQPEVDATRIAVIGTSLGVVFATALGARHGELRAVVAISGFATWQGMAHDIVPVFGGAALRPGLDPALSVTELQMPLLIVHSDADELIDPEHARRIYAQAVAHDVAVDVHVLRGLPHNAPFEGEKQRVVETFLRRHLRAP